MSNAQAHPHPSQTRYRVGRAVGAADLEALARLRHLAFFGSQGVDRDAYDPLCQHFAVHDMRSGAVVGGFRVMMLTGAQAVQRSYSAQFYDLAPLAKFPKPMLELGRVCVHPQCGDADVLRLAWGALAGLVAQHDVGLIFGCSSFEGADPALHAAHLAHLRDTHLGPAQWRPGVKSAQAIALENVAPAPKTTPLPALLRTYLMMGGWVGDHAVRDTDMNTTHIFTALEIDAIPPSRKRLLQGWQSD